jgi:hypothetical protein
MPTEYNQEPSESMKAFAKEFLSKIPPAPQYGKRAFNGRKCWHEDIITTDDGVKCLQCDKQWKDESNNQHEVPK